MKLLRLRGALDITKCPFAGNVTYGIVGLGGQSVEVELAIESPRRSLEDSDNVYWIKTTWSESQGERHFAFLSEQDRALFCLLINKVDGVGPAAALAVVKHANVSDIKTAAETGDFKTLAKMCPGVGPKTAETIARTLAPFLGTKFKEGKKPGPPDARLVDVKKALVAMGYKAAEADTVVSALTPSPEDTTESLLKMALKKPRN